MSESGSGSHSHNAADVAFLSQLARGLAHEIKNPLSTMAIHLALLQEDTERAASRRSDGEPQPTPREERALKRIGAMQREISRMEHIVDEFLRYARGGEINRKAEDIVQVVRELLDFVEPEDEKAGIRHHADMAVSLPLVLLDRDRFKQALLNLFVNARQAMPEGGELLVRVQRHGNFVELSVTDTGIGMNEQQLARCFEIYWSDKKGGTGLGLATTRRIIEEHAGRLTVTSEPGRGTSFSIFLPLVVEITGGTRAFPAGVDSVDDERVSRARMVRILEEEAEVDEDPDND